LYITITIPKHHHSKFYTYTRAAWTYSGRNVWSSPSASEILQGMTRRSTPHCNRSSRHSCTCPRKKGRQASWSLGR